MLVLLCVLGLFSQSFGQLISKGECPQPEPVEGFSEKKLIGKWKDAWKINNTYEPSFECAGAEFAIEDYLTQYLSGIMPIAGVAIQWNGKFIPKDNCDPGVYTVPFAPYATDSGFDTVTYTHANWDSWFIQYGCSQKDQDKWEYAWVYVKDINDIDAAAISLAIDSLGLSITDLTKTDHCNCPDDN